MVDKSAKNFFESLYDHIDQKEMLVAKISTNR